MTPKEKAEELVTIFFQYLPVETAKKCAVKVVLEIIKSRKDDGSFDDSLSSTSSEYYTPHPMYLTYWLQVRQEIQKL